MTKRKDEDARLVVVVPLDMKDELQAAANRKGVNLSSFIRMVLYERLDEGKRAA